MKSFMIFSYLELYNSTDKLNIIIFYTFFADLVCRGRRLARWILVPPYWYLFSTLRNFYGNASSWVLRWAKLVANAVLDSPWSNSNYSWYIHQHVGKGNAALMLINDYIAFVIHTLCTVIRKPKARFIIYNKKNKD